MDNKHPHAAAIDRIGRDRIIKHYNITTRTIQLWRAKGVPKMHWNTLRILAATNGTNAAELGA